jgi:hypothetical protein
MIAVLPGNLSSRQDAGGETPMSSPEIGDGRPLLEEASRELEAAAHDVRVAFDCIALGELDRAHTSAVEARVAVDAAVIALQAALGMTSEAAGL